MRKLTSSYYREVGENEQREKVDYGSTKVSNFTMKVVIRCRTTEFCLEQLGI